MAQRAGSKNDGKNYPNVSHAPTLLLRRVSGGAFGGRGRVSCDRDRISNPLERRFLSTSLNLANQVPRDSPFDRGGCDEPARTKEKEEDVEELRVLPVD